LTFTGELTTTFDLELLRSLKDKVTTSLALNSVPQLVTEGLHSHVTKNHLTGVWVNLGLTETALKSLMDLGGFGEEIDVHHFLALTATMAADVCIIIAFLTEFIELPFSD
jgi:hypothetical protein